MGKEKIVLAYSGGLDTSVAIRWLQEKLDALVITATIDLGMVNLQAVKQRALNCGAFKAVTVDGKNTFVNEFILPALRADAVYQDQYPLATALGRPLIARYLTQVAKKEGAYAVAHGCTGKGNDQVRLDLGVAALAPELKIIAPIREWGMSREDELEYAQKHDIPVQVKESTYSTDENLWGRSIEAGDLENPWSAPSEEAFAWTKDVKDTPDDPVLLEIDFENGFPISVDGRTMNSVEMIRDLNELAGQHGIGRIDHLEDRLVGIKSREVYESPAALVLHAAHKALETMTLSKTQLSFKKHVAQEYADLVYNALWFTSHREDLDAYVGSTQRYVTGTIRIKFHKGTCTIVGRKSPFSLYQYNLATYDRADSFDHRAAEGFISIYSLPVRTQSKIQGEQEEEN